MCVPEEIVENFNLIKAIFEETDTSNRWQLVTGPAWPWRIY
jgi:hypothetical protein